MEENGQVNEDQKMQINVKKEKLEENGQVVEEKKMQINVKQENDPCSDSKDTSKVDIIIYEPHLLHVL